MVTLDITTYAVAALAVFLISFMKGVFGGGLALLGIPLLSLVMPPLQAGVLLAPLFIVMDVVALRYWKPSTWSKPDPGWILPAMIVGTALGYFFLSSISERGVALFIGLLTVVFTLHWFLSGAAITQRPRSAIKALLAGAGCGFTSMVAHAGGPPIALYLLPLGLPRAIYAGTTSIVFTFGNIIKLAPWFLIVTPSTNSWWLMLYLLPVVPIGVWVGWRLHNALSDQRLYRFCYALLLLVGLKLLYDSLTGG